MTINQYATKNDVASGLVNAGVVQSFPEGILSITNEHQLRQYSSQSIPEPSEIISEQLSRLCIVLEYTGLACHRVGQSLRQLTDNSAITSPTLGGGWVPT